MYLYASARVVGLSVPPPVCLSVQFSFFFEWVGKAGRGGDQGQLKKNIQAEWAHGGGGG